MTIIISPHLDDAVLSLGQFMARKPTTVVTVFAGLPNGGVSAYDEACGFTDSREAMTERRLEDEKACATLGATPVHLDFHDRQYRLSRDPDAIVAAIAEAFGTGDRVWAPLGLGHQDHRLVAACARAALPEFSELIVYEDFPYRTLWPEQVHPALERIVTEGFVLQPYEVKQGSRQLKEDAVACYRSQYPDGPNDPCLYVPERAWRVTR